MTLTELRFFVALVQEQHFGRAAKRCHVSQPTLSTAIKKLEDKLSAALIERTQGRIFTTELGAQIAAKARELLTQTQTIKDLATTHKHQLQAPLRLGTLASIGPYWLPQAIAQLRATAPLMPLHLEENTPELLAGKLRQGELDVLLINLPFSAPDVVTQPLCNEDFVLLLPQQHPLAAKTLITGEDITGLTLFLPTDSPELPHSWQHNPTHTSLEMMRLMIASELGVGLVPRCTAQNQQLTQHALVFRPLATPAPTRTLALAWRASFPRHQAIEALRRALQFSSAAFWNFTTGRSGEEAPARVDNHDW